MTGWEIREKQLQHLENIEIILKDINKTLKEINTTLKSKMLFNKKGE